MSKLMPLDTIVEEGTCAGEKNYRFSTAINEKIKSLEKEYKNFKPFSFLPGVTSKRDIQDKIQVLKDFRTARFTGSNMDFSKYSRGALTGYTRGLLEKVPKALPGLADNIVEDIKNGIEKRAKEKSVFNRFCK